MSDSNHLKDAVNRILWSAEGHDQGNILAVIDAARDNIIYPKLLECDNKKVSLFIGRQARQLATVAPYLVKLDEEDFFTQWLLDHGWGKSWCIFAESEAPFGELENHFWSFLRVADEDGKTFYFRYYDPRVFRVFLPTCDPEQLETMFGPVRHYYVEGEKGDKLMRYLLRDGKLIQEDMPLLG